MRPRQPSTCLQATVWDARTLDAILSEATLSGYGFWVLPTIHLPGGNSLGGYSLRGYSLGLRILDLANHSLVWSLHTGTLPSGRLQSRRLQFQATDFGSRQPFTCVEATLWKARISVATDSGYGSCIANQVLGTSYKLVGYSLRRYSLGQRFLDLANHSHLCRLQIGRLESRRLQTRATDLASPTKYSVQATSS